MQLSSQHHKRSNMPNILYYQPIQTLEAYYIPQIHPLSHINTIDDSFHIYQDQYCTLESSSLGANYSSYNSSSTVSFSPTESSLSHQESCVTDDVDDLKHKLKELETVMLGPDLDILDTSDNNLSSSAQLDTWRQMMVAIPRGDLKQILIACAKAVCNNDSLMAQWLMSELRQIVSVSGEPIQRLGAYMLEGLVARLNSSGSSIYKSLKGKEPKCSELLSYMNILHEVCPFFKFGYMSANGAIAEAMKGEERVHIIDFQISQGSQWISLIRAFASRPGGPPRIRMTCIDDVNSAYAREGGFSTVGRRLSKLAKTVNIPFEFRIASITLENLEIRPDEALAVNFAFMLHHTADESVSTENHRDRLLRMVKGLNPKVVTLVEQEFNTNTAAFYPRFLEALDYYTAMFDSIDVILPREHKERINVEQHCLAREIVNVIACEGIERVERHELVGKWRSRFKMAGFSPCPLSGPVNATIKTLLENYCKEYRLVERDGALYLGWLDRNLVASCAWK